MTLLGWLQCRRAPLAVALGTCLMACREDVPLGAWNLPPGPGGQGGQGGSTTTASTVSGTGGGAGAPDSGGDPPVLPACLASAEPGPLNLAGDVFGATETATDWTWPDPVSSVQWDLMVEREIAPTTPATRGYYWAYQFSFLEGAAGFFGIQAQGVYRSDPPDSQLFVEKIAVFWLSGPPLDAELGDIPYPDARIAPTTAAGVSYQTIHARFDWQPCRVYRFRIEQHSTESGGSCTSTLPCIWYGAWIEDTEDHVETFLGRMLLPADSGELSPFSISRTLPISYVVDETSCDVQPHGSAIFGAPHSVEGDVQATVRANRFGHLACPTSRLTQFDGAVRHEQGVSP